MKGFYALVIRVKKTTALKIGTMRNPEISPGVLVYVGSAQGSGSTSIERRIARHFRSEKKVHWHIDYLLDLVGGPEGALWVESENGFECSLVQMLERSPSFESILKGFGASDCQAGCNSHLLRYAGSSSARAELEQIIAVVGFESHWTDSGEF